MRDMKTTHYAPQKPACKPNLKSGVKIGGPTNVCLFPLVTPKSKAEKGGSEPQKHTDTSSRRQDSARWLWPWCWRLKAWHRLAKRSRGMVPFLGMVLRKRKRNTSFCVIRPMGRNKNIFPLVIRSLENQRGDFTYSLQQIKGKPTSIFLGPPDFGIPF